MAREWWEQVHRHHVVSSHAARNLRRLELHIFPAIGQLPINEVTAPQLLAALRQVEQKGSIETAHRLRTLTGQVWDMGKWRQSETSTAIPTRPGPTSKNQFSLPEGGSYAVHRETSNTMLRSTSGIRKYPTLPHGPFWILLLPLISPS